MKLASSLEILPSIEPDGLMVRGYGLSYSFTKRILYKFTRNKY
jgi:hypothetical protein